MDPRPSSVKRPPPKPKADAVEAAAAAAAEGAGNGNNGNGNGGCVNDVVEAHFAALRADDGVSWDRQARSVLVDGAMSVVVWTAAAMSVANALGVNVTGVLAVGGFSGVAVGFAAQRCVANMISGGLIYLTQARGRSTRRPRDRFSTTSSNQI